MRLGTRKRREVGGMAGKWWGSSGRKTVAGEPTRDVGTIRPGHAEGLFTESALEEKARVGSWAGICGNKGRGAGGWVGGGGGGVEAAKGNVQGQRFGCRKELGTGQGAARGRSRPKGGSAVRLGAGAMDVSSRERPSGMKKGFVREGASCCVLVQLLQVGQTDNSAWWQPVLHLPWLTGLPAGARFRYKLILTN